MSFVMSPKALRDAFVDAGFEVAVETEYTWLMVRPTAPDEPFCLPRKGARVAANVMQEAMDHAPASTLHTSIYNRAQRRESEAE